MHESSLLLEASCSCTCVQAIHPGYGFLSENAAFCRACADAGVTFIGPPVNAIEAMGSKSASKDIMLAAKVPCTPGYHGENQDAAHLLAEAKNIQFPVMIKAVLGGGGKGMRIVHNEAEFVSALDACRREAMASFNDDVVLLERYLTKPRHIEVQVFADAHGHVGHFYERDCSVQRRHQKVLEEAPAPGMTPVLRKRMTDAAVAAARAVGYQGAGTVEFMVDEDVKPGTSADDKEFFFMEMNTRLQVEHPVTELITGVDLVELQLRAAAGERLPQLEEEGPIIGHALEARVYAENPLANFLPATGSLQHLSAPEHMPGVRVDTGVREGDEVSIFYDPMISKLIVHGADREQALRRMTQALAEYRIVGLPNNLAFLAKCIKHPDFVAGGVDTSFLAKHLDSVLPTAAPVPDIVSALTATLQHVATLQAALADSASKGPLSPWDVSDASRPMGELDVKVAFLDEAAADEEQDGAVNVALKATVGGGAAGAGGFFADAIGNDMPAFSATVGGSTYSVQVKGLQADGSFVAVVDGHNVNGTVVFSDDATHVYIPTGMEKEGEATQFTLGVPAPDHGAAGEGSGAPTVMTPMPGKVVKVLAKEGDSVEAGQPVVILEAMKMEHVINAPITGKVVSIKFAEGEQVGSGDVLAEFAAEE